MVSGPESVPPRGAVYEWQWGWALVVLANLPVPLFLGLLCVSEGGVFGMFAGIFAVWLLGCVAVVRRPRVRRALVYSGGLFALSQAFPIVQFSAGAVALDVCAEGRHSAIPAPTAFAVTVLTGGQLVTAALACGLLAHVCGQLLGRLLAGHPHNPV